ncbi:hypothetical protein [Actinomadura sp. K4S16]|uniref:hypothetical protein n=1 Tax=Actinomadura sp. K4S16 TaxID=1316147 RepID=UPI0011F03CFC|nr:hypothetical protein [Actinomadura sp. K4S16]
MTVKLSTLMKNQPWRAAMHQALDFAGPIRSPSRQVGEGGRHIRPGGSWAPLGGHRCGAAQRQSVIALMVNGANVADDTDSEAEFLKCCHATC